MAGVLTVADWLRTRPISDDTSAEARALGDLAVLVAGLQAARGVPEPAAPLLARLSDELAALPPQFEGLAAETGPGLWIRLGALCELREAPQLAQLILDTLILAATNAADDRGERIDHTGQRELAALCWARRGRLARVAAQLDDADACYRTARRLVGAAPWRDARPHAEMGLTVLAVHRGNFPEAERRARRVLAHRPPVYPMYRIQAHQVLAVTKRRRGQLLDALLHSWEAYDLLPSDDPRRLELLVPMSEIAAAYGDWHAAYHGFMVVAGATGVSRVRIPALCGALQAIVHERHPVRSGAQHGSTPSERLTAVWNALADAAADSRSPGDTLLAAVALGEAAMQLEWLAGAREWLQKAGELAEAHGFHEQRLRVEALWAAMPATHHEQAPVYSPTPPARRSPRTSVTEGGRTSSIEGPPRPMSAPSHTGALNVGPSSARSDAARRARIRQRHPALARLANLGLSATVAS